MNKIPLPYSRSDLVLPEEVQAELDRFIAIVRDRGRVAPRDDLPVDHLTSAGVHALFWGPAGTGKKMATQVAARDLGMDLFRVDLGTIVSKYVGETEKNLDRVFAQAENANAILFFEEADALFGRRSEVKDAHDRFANIEVSYLLQRMEAHRGTLVLASNRKGNIDSAFMRRLTTVIQFPLPSERERRELWERMLPPNHPGVPEETIRVLARDFGGTGGEIRQAVLAATVLAAGQNTQLADTHLTEAVRRVLASRGQGMPR